MKRKKKVRRRVVQPTHDHHHIINRCHGGDDHVSNKLYIRIKRHRALHKMFENSNLRMIYLIIKETNHRLIMSDADNLNDWFDLFGDKTKCEALTFLERLIRAKEAQRRSDGKETSSTVDINQHLHD